MVTQECVEKLIKKDMVDPVTGDNLHDKDIILLQRVHGHLYLHELENQDPFLLHQIR